MIITSYYNEKTKVNLSCHLDIETGKKEYKQMINGKSKTLNKKQYENRIKKQLNI